MIRLLTDIERKNLKEWSYRVSDESITTTMLNPFWEMVVKIIPEYVAPNVLSIAGLCMILFSYHLTYYHALRFPRLMSLCSALLIFAYQTLDAIDGKHARNTKNSSPLGELFDHACDSIGTVFIILTVSHHLGVTDVNTLFYVTQSGLLVFLLEHLHAFNTRTVRFSRYTGPGEIIMLCIIVLLFKSLTGWSVIPWSMVNKNYFYHAVIAVYWCCYVLSFITIWTSYLFPITSGVINISEIKDNSEFHFGTYAGLSFCLSMRIMNGMLLYFDMIADWSLQDVIAHALVLSVIVCDLIVAKMANRELHSIIVIGSMLTMFNHSLFTFVLVACYFCRIFYEICSSQNLFLLSPAKNVYICGVWDLMHYGHMQHFVEAAKMGNRLIVGVHSDEDVESYKRKPTLNTTERCKAVRMCALVSEVIPNAPLVTSAEFIEKYKIHTVGCSTEYDTPDDEWYRVPREMGILNVVPRVEGVSTSELRKRVADDVTSQNKKNV